MDVLQDMTSLYTAGLLGEIFLSYLSLRSQNLGASKFEFRNIGYLSMTETDKFLISIKLAEKKLINFNPFPDFRINFYSLPIALSEEEVKRSRDTINATAYLFNAMQVECRRLNTTTILLNSEFRDKWDISTDDFMQYFPQVLRTAKERFQITAISPTPLTLSWSAIATHNPSDASANDLHSLFSLGLPHSCYLFWILRFMKMRSPLEINLQAIEEQWKILSDDSLKALSDLAKVKILTYEINSIKLIWKKTLSLLPRGELNYVSSLMRSEGKIAYALQESNLVNPVEFCNLNNISQADFYKSLRILKRREIISFLISGAKLTWSYFYEPAPLPTPAPTPAPISAPTSAPAPTPESTPTPAPTKTNYNAESVDSGYSYDLIELSTEAIDDLGYSQKKSIEQFANAMQSLFSGASDDEFVASPDLGFDFPFNGQIFRKVFISSNSYISFGYGSSSYKPDVEVASNALFICAGDRQMRNVYFSRPSVDSFRIRYEGRDSAQGDGLDIRWQVTLFPNGVIEILLLTFNYMSMGLLELRQTREKAIRFPIPDSRSIVLYPRDGGARYTAHEGRYVMFHPLLARFPGASLAFSFRKLNQSDEERIIADANGFVRMWKNQAIASNPAIQNNPALQPKLASINEKQALEFDGIDDYLEFSNLPGQSFSIFILLQRKDSAIHQYGDIVSTDDNGTTIFFREDNRWGTYGNNQEQMANSILEIDQPYLLEMHASDGSGSFYINSQFDGFFNSTQGQLPRIGGYPILNECSSMALAEIIFYPFNNEFNREAIAQDIIEFYGL